MRIVFATQNKGKLIEMRKILSGFEVLGMEDIGIFDDIIEDGKTFEENALKKARFVAERIKDYVIADDSGICIQALGGAPGVYSARWAGEGASGEEIVNHTLKKMEGIQEGKRKAWFETAAVLITPEGEEKVFVGKVDGAIPLTPSGKALPKLPYDVIFIPDGHDKTFAEISEEEKNAMSHRGKAFRELKKYLQNEIRRS